jgi:predicted O-methyltransferase YrrM
MITKPKRQETVHLRKFIERLYSDGIVRGEDGTQHPISPASVTADRGAFIRDVCISEGATRTLEIGMAWGVSTLFILEALLENDAGPGAHLVIDPYEFTEYHGAGRRNVKEAGLEELTEIKEEASEVLLPKFILQGRRFDFAFIDGSHLFDNVFVDLVFTHRLLKPGGVVVFDDTFTDAVHLTCRFAETNYGYSSVADHQSGGGVGNGRQKEGWRATMRALRKPPEETVRGTFHFIPFFPQGLPQGGFTESAWHHNDLIASTGALRPEDNSGMTSYAFSSSGHVFYIDTSKHVHELWFDLAQSPGWNHRDLTASAGAPIPAAGAALTSYAVDSSGHVFYIDTSNHVCELWFDLAQGPGWHHTDLIASAGAPIPAAGTALTSYPLGSSGHVFYIDRSNHVRELWFDLTQGSHWHQSDLTVSAKAPPPAAGTALTSYTLGSSCHVFYIDTRNHVRELWFDLTQGSGWHHNDLTASARASTAAAGTALTSYPMASSGHVLFIDADHHLHELWFDPTQGQGWHHNDLTASAGAPILRAGTSLTNYGLGSSSHVLFVDNQPDVSELYFVRSN